MARKRHSNAEIVAKLAQAELLATEGKTQGDIAWTLGVSVMTLHRWRKVKPQPQRAMTVSATSQQAELARESPGLIAELRLENSRLRRLVTDLLLEKVKLEESIWQPAKRTG
jgi:putative transposase